MGRKSIYYVIEEPRFMVKKRKNDEILSESLFEYDASPQAWCYYKDKYTSIAFSNYFCGAELRIKAFGMPNGKNEGIVMSGDLAFNFNPDKVERYIKYFPDIKSEKEFLEQFHLEEYHNLKQNRILIPVTGGLNNYKNSLSGKLDRFDFYVCLVDKIIKEKEVKTKEGISIEWSEILVKFLSQYTIEEFCSNLLLITCENYRKELLNLGAQELNTQENILKYIALAHGYWEMCGDENYKYRYNGKYNNYWNNL